MKTITLLFCFIIGVYSHSNAQKASAQVANEEQKEDSKSSKYGDRTAYQITFKDGTTGKIWKAEESGKWWGSNGLQDRGPYTKDQAIQWLWTYKHPSNSGGSALGAAAAGAALSGSKKSTTPAKSKRTSINFRKRK